MTRHPTRRVALLAVLAVLGGCGLKGTLTLPEKSQNIVIRGQATTPPAGEGTPTTGEAAPAAPPVPERLPPPELPRSSSGTSR